MGVTYKRDLVAAAIRAFGAAPKLKLRKPARSRNWTATVKCGDVVRSAQGATTVAAMIALKIAIEKESVK